VKRKQRSLKKARKNFWELRALAPGVPIIATCGGDYRHSPSNRPQEQKILFLQKKKSFLRAHESI